MASQERIGFPTMKKPSLQLYVACEPKVVPLDVLTWPLTGLLSTPQLTANDKNECYGLVIASFPGLPYRAWERG